MPRQSVMASAMNAMKTAADHWQSSRQDVHIIITMMVTDGNAYGFFFKRNHTNIDEYAVDS